MNRFTKNNVKYSEFKKFLKSGTEPPSPVHVKRNELSETNENYDDIQTQPGGDDEEIYDDVDTEAKSKGSSNSKKSMTYSVAHVEIMSFL